MAEPTFKNTALRKQIDSETLAFILNSSVMELPIFCSRLSLYLIEGFMA